MNAIDRLAHLDHVEDELAQAVALIDADIAHTQAKGQYFQAWAAGVTEEQIRERRERYFDTRATHVQLRRQWKDTHR